MKNVNEMFIEIMKSKDFNAKDFAKGFCDKNCEECPFCYSTGYYTYCQKNTFVEICNKMKKI